MIKVRELSCGARLIMEKIPYVQSVSIGIWAKAGAINEEPEISGISHFIEHMSFKGTNRRNAKQIAEDADRIAGQINAFTGKEATCYYMKTLSSNFEKGADILLDMFLESQFDQTEMDRERMVIFEEMKMIEDSPEDDIHDLIAELAFAGKNLSKSIIGTQDSLNNIDRGRILAYREREYTTDSIVVSVAGNFDEEEVFTMFDGKFEQFGKTKVLPSDDESIIYKPSFLSKVKDIEQSHVCLSVPGIARSDDRFNACSIVNNVMGGSMSSRFFQNIREEKGLAYSVYSMNSTFTNEGYYCIYAGVSHDKIEACIGGIKEELDILKNKGISAEEIAIAKEQIKGSYIYSMENTNSRMFGIGRNLLLDNLVYETEEVIEEMNKVTVEDVREAASLITDINNYCGAVISNKEIPIEEYIRK